MEEDLDWLKALLIEHGGAEIVIAIERAAREGMPPLDTRSELKLVFDELYTVLVGGFKTVSYTMDLLGAETLTFSEDVASFDLDNGRTTQSSRETTEGVAFSQARLAEWARLASEADLVLKEMGERYDLV